MKRVLILSVLFIFTVSIASAATITRSNPPRHAAHKHYNHKGHHNHKGAHHHRHPAAHHPRPH